MNRTYPSMYMVIEGGLTVTDSCGTLGKTYHNPTIAIPPGGLSSMSFTQGVTDPHYVNAVFGSNSTLYDPAQPSSCQTYGFGIPRTITAWETFADGKSSLTSSLFLTLGPPYNPIISPPSELLTFDPAWKACQRWDNSYGGKWGFLTCKRRQALHNHVS